MRSGKPSAVFAEDELVMAILVGEPVKSSGEDAITVVAVATHSKSA